ncbi:SulA-like leucine-rich domain-containing protein [Vibrio sp. CAU 1672]|uniref:SulA-like leucine-rich domain-containing protein n=1 Tax=Vibrio sp. CAU 1672 TaxID=3032594 RepID=UPI0023DC13CF|nr:SulA-like leucine-rich domain-containing protein [Vibrio sp. CAU 1672]MDF2152363.1 SulA-like leucine-rich domain-containing protein [Vibrio sp. CAU 1672]
MQFQSHGHSYSRFNVLAQTTQPMNVPSSLLAKLATLSQQQQWILFTAECPRPDFAQLTASKIRCQNIIQMKPSQQQSEVEIVVKAIRSGNASAVVASTNIAHINQIMLRDLAQRHQCEVFFVEGRANKYH